VDVQVFESTNAVLIEDPVEQTGALLSLGQGPGRLGQVFDGLQKNPLEDIALAHSVFLPRSVELPALDPRRCWSFLPHMQTGTRLRTGDTLGSVQEGAIRHRIMVPFGETGEVEVAWIQEGKLAVETLEDLVTYQKALSLDMVYLQQGAYDPVDA
jgi:V/A-type H+-transporting ATPase subunit A